MEVLYELALIVALTVVNGVFTGAEIAMLSVRRTRLRELADEGSRAARAAIELRRAPEALLATIQVGITVIGASTAVFGGARLEAPIARALERLGLASVAEPASFTIVIVVVSYFSLVIGELVPKSLALRSPERFVLWIARPLAVLSQLSRPVVWLLTVSSNVVLRPFRDRTTFSESRLSPDELQQLVEESAASGALHRSAGEIASRAIDLSRLRANALMVPRAKIVSLSTEWPAERCLDVMRASPHARYPLHEGDLEKVVGYVVARDIYDAMLRGSLVLRDLVRPMPFFPESVAALDVLRRLQSAKQQLALLVEEEGGIAGLISIEDVAEDLLGEILEEHEAPRVTASREADGTVVAVGTAPVHELERLLDEDLHADDTTATTIGGLIVTRLHRWPQPGERVPLTARVEAEVVESSPRELRKVRLHTKRDAS